MTDSECTCGLDDQEVETVTYDGDDIEPYTMKLPLRTWHLWDCPLADPLADIRRVQEVYGTFRHEDSEPPRPAIGLETEVWFHDHNPAVEVCTPNCFRAPTRSERNYLYPGESDRGHALGGEAIDTSDTRIFKKRLRG